MKIKLSPVASNKTTSVSVSGLVLTIDGIEYDLSIIPDGGQAEASEDYPFIGTVKRDSVTIRYEYDSLKAEPNQSTDWDDWTFFVESGDVPCPVKWKEIPPEVTEEIVDDNS